MTAEIQASGSTGGRVAPARIRLLGVFRAMETGSYLMFPPACRRVLAYLAVHEAASRSEVAGALWPDHPQARAQSDLRTTLWRLRRVSQVFVELNADVMSLREDVTTDVREVTAWASEAITPSAVTPTERPTIPPGGDLELLPGWDDGWLDAPRARLRMLQLQALESIAGRLLAASRAPEALPFLLDVTEADPLRESAQYLMLEVHIRQGNIAQALHQFETYRRRLRSELGIEPGVRVTSLIAQYATRTTKAVQAPT